MMWTYFDLVTDRTPQEVEALQGDVEHGKKHPMDVKMSLAQEILAGFHGADAAAKAAAEFQRIFRDRQVPQEMKEIVLKRLPMGISVRSKSGSTMSSHMATGLSMGPEKWSKLLAYLGEAGSASEAERVIKQGGFEINGSLVKDPTCKLDLNQPNSYEVRVGKKKFLRIVVE
jgi:tyrosyl-tRNA synthetase